MAGICIFAASSPNIDDKYIAAAESFGRCLAEHGLYSAAGARGLWAHAHAGYIQRAAG